MKLQQLYSKVRQALQDYDMVQPGDRIAIGISGGKDSLTLLYALAGLRRFYPVSFEIVAITVDIGFEGFDLSPIEALCQELDVEYHIVHTEIEKILNTDSCSLCARMRKGALNEKALELKCSKIAYAHNTDDVVETMMLSMIYEGRFSTFWPVTPLEKTNLTVIRPLVFVSKADVIGFKNKYQLPVVSNPCPYDHNSERTYVRDLLDEMNRHAPGVKQRMMTAITDGTLDHWKGKNS